MTNVRCREILSEKITASSNTGELDIVWAIDEWPCFAYGSRARASNLPPASLLAYVIVEASKGDFKKLWLELRKD